jgi:predicted RNA-binding Zn-ribbon protein involved in translation (DUF1610 family)
MTTSFRAFQQRELICPDCGKQNIVREQMTFTSLQGTIQKWKDYICETEGCGWRSYRRPTGGVQ